METSRQIEDDRFDHEELRYLQTVHLWLKAASVDSDQYTFSKIREDYPGTGQWLLDNTLFKEWFDPQYPTIPPLLWLSGIPGAGNCLGLGAKRSLDTL